MPAKPPVTSRLGWVLGLTSTAYFMVVLDALVVITCGLRHRDHALRREPAAMPASAELPIPA